MHNAWGSYPIFLRTLTLWSLSSVCWWNANRSFWYFVPSWDFVEHLVCLEPFSLLGVWHLSFCVYHWISHSLMYLSFYILQVLIYSFGISSSLGNSLSIGIGSWKYWACILTSCSIFGMLSFFDPIYRETPPSLKLDEMCMEFIFISICTYLCGVCPMYCWFSQFLVPMSLGTILFVLLF